MVVAAASTRRRIVNLSDRLVDTGIRKRVKLKERRHCGIVLALGSQESSGTVPTPFSTTMGIDSVCIARERKDGFGVTLGG